MPQLAAAAAPVALLLLAAAARACSDVTTSGRGPRAADEPSNKYLPPGAGSSAAGAREYLPPAEAEGGGGGGAATTEEAPTTAGGEAGKGSSTGPLYLPPANETEAGAPADDGGEAATEKPAGAAEEKAEGEKTSGVAEGAAEESGKTTTPAPKYLPPGNEYLPPENVTDAAKDGTSSTEDPEMGEGSPEGTTEAKEESGAEETVTEKASGGEGGENDAQSPGPEYLPPSGTYLPPSGKKPEGEAAGNGKNAGGDVSNGKTPAGGGGPAKRPAITYLPPDGGPPSDEAAAKPTGDEGGDTAATTEAAAEEATTAAEKAEGSTEASNGGTTSGGYDLKPPASYLPPGRGAGASRKYVPPGGPATGSTYRGNRYLPPGGPASSSRKYLPPGGSRGGDRMAAAESRNTLVTVDPRDRAARARERLLKRGRGASRARTTTTERSEDDVTSIEEKIAASQSTSTVQPSQSETDPTDSDHKDTKPRWQVQSMTKRHRQRYRTNVAAGKPVRRRGKPVTSHGTARVHVTFSRTPVQSEPPPKPPVLEVIASPESAVESEDAVAASRDVLQPDSSREAPVLETSSNPSTPSDIDDAVPHRQSETSTRRVSPQRTPEVFDDYDEDYVWEQVEVDGDESEAQTPSAGNYFEAQRSFPRQKGFARPRPVPTQVHRKKPALPPRSAEEPRITGAPTDAAGLDSRTAARSSAVRTSRPQSEYRPRSHWALPVFSLANAPLETAGVVSITPRPPAAARHADNLPRHQQDARAAYSASSTGLDTTQFISSTPHPPATLHRAGRLPTEDQLKTEEAGARYSVSDGGLDRPAFASNLHSVTAHHASRPLSDYHPRPRGEHFTYSATDSHFQTAGTLDSTPHPATAVHTTIQPPAKYQPKAAEVHPTYSGIDALLKPPEFISNELNHLSNAQDTNNPPITYQPKPKESHQTYRGTDGRLDPSILISDGQYHVTGAQETNRPPAKAPHTYSVADTHTGPPAIISTTLHPPTVIHQTSKPLNKYQPKTVPKTQPRFHYHTHYRIQRSATPDLAPSESAQSHVRDSGRERNIQPRESATNGNGLSLVQLLHSFFTANLRRNTDPQGHRDIDSLPSATSRPTVDTAEVQSSADRYRGSPSSYQLTPSGQQPPSSPYQLSLSAHHLSTNAHQLYHGSSVTPNLPLDAATAPVPTDLLHSAVKSLDRDRQVGARPSPRIQEPVHEDSYSTDSLHMEEQLGEHENNPTPSKNDGSKHTLLPQNGRNKPGSHPLPSPMKSARRGNGCDASLVASASNGSKIEQQKLPRDCRFAPRFPQRSLAVRLRPRITDNAKRNETLEKSAGPSFAGGETEDSLEGAENKSNATQYQLHTKQSGSPSPVQDTNDKATDAVTESAASKARPKLNTRLSAFLLEHSASQHSRGSTDAEPGGAPRVERNRKLAADSENDESRNLPLRASASQQHSTKANASRDVVPPAAHRRTPALQRRYGTSDHRPGGAEANAGVVSHSQSGRASVVASEDGSGTEESQTPVRSRDSSHWPFAASGRKRADIKKSNSALDNSTKEARVRSNSALKSTSQRTETTSVDSDSPYGTSANKVKTKAEDTELSGHRKLGAVTSKLHARRRSDKKDPSSSDVAEEERSDISTIDSEASGKLERARPGAGMVSSDSYYLSRQEASVRSDQKQILNTDLYNKKTGQSSHVRIYHAVTTPRAPESVSIDSRRKPGTTPREIGDYSSEESAVTDSPYESGILGGGLSTLGSNAGSTVNNDDREVRDFLDRFLPLILAQERPVGKEERANIQVLGKEREDSRAAKLNLSRSNRKYPNRGHVRFDTVAEASYESVSSAVAPAVTALSPGSGGDRRRRGFETKHFVRELPSTRAAKQPFILNITEEPEGDLQAESDCDGHSTCRIGRKEEQTDDDKGGTSGPSSHVSRRFLHKKIAAHAKSDALYTRNNTGGRNPLEVLLTSFRTGPRRQPPASAGSGLTQEVSSVTAPPATEAQSGGRHYLPAEAEAAASPSQTVARLAPQSASAPADGSAIDLSPQLADQFREFLQLLPQSLQSELLASDTSASSYYPSENTPDSQGSYSLLGQNSYRAEDTPRAKSNPSTNVFQLFQFQSPEASFPEESNSPKLTSVSRVSPDANFRASDILVPPPVQLPATAATTPASGETRGQTEHRYPTSVESRAAQANSNAPSSDFSTKFGTQYTANIEGGRIRFGLFFPSTVAAPV